MRVMLQSVAAIALLLCVCVCVCVCVNSCVRVCKHAHERCHNAKKSQGGENTISIMVMIATMTTLQFVMLSEVCEKGSACVDIRMQQLQGSWEHKHLGKLCGVTKEALGETRNA